MIEIYGNLWDQTCDAICITTNGFVKSNGRAVMGRGCAKEALLKYPNIDLVLGTFLQIYGNVVQILKAPQDSPHIVAFPVKSDMEIYDGTNCVTHLKSKMKYGSKLPGWMCTANITLIQDSAQQLVDLTNKMGYTKVVLPRPGCGAGELKWEDVRKVLAGILDDRFYVITKE